MSGKRASHRYHIATGVRVSNNKNKKLTSLAGFILMLVCLLPALWFMHDRIDLLQQAELENAIIIKCDYKWGSVSSSGGTRRNATSYAPIAISEQGNKVRGTLWWASRDVCERSLNKRVSVLVNPTDQDKSRINTFFQFYKHSKVCEIFHSCFVLRLHWVLSFDSIPWIRH